MLLLWTIAALAQPPVVHITADNTRIDRSCTIEIAPGAVIRDADGDGVIHIEADGITVEFAPGSVLRGAVPTMPGDQLTGMGVRVKGHTGVTLRNAHVSGFKVGINAEACDGLTIDTADLSGNYHQLLKSTPQAEDGGDWLYPHHNDQGEWVKNYGAALAIKNATKATVRSVTVRNGQNGIILDRVNDSRVFDNDCSFISGWGIAMWRSSRNTITRNALDFCIRGYSHGIYNRGQDSAGLLMFEQCSDNIITQNSITHGGDGIFGFGGSEAIGETPPPSPDFDYKKRGCNNNIFADNDLSYAAAHGLEMTFSHGNRVFRNRMVANAICGIWGGYSTGMLIAENTFEDNGEMAYGLERGGINIEHGSRNLMLGNAFARNKCGIHLWWDDDAGLLTKPGVAASGSDVEGNIVADNSFSGDAIALHLRDGSKDRDKVRDTVVLGNTFENVSTEMQADKGIVVKRDGAAPTYTLPTPQILREAHPVGARSSLRGRQQIIMTDWGPWDHQSPLVRPVAATGAKHIYELFNFPKDAKDSVRMADGTSADAVLVQKRDADAIPQRVELTPKAPGVYSYTIEAAAGDYRFSTMATIIQCEWQVRLFPWQGVVNPPSPPADLEAWRALAKGKDAINARTGDLSFKFGNRGPMGVKSVPEFAGSKLGSSFYGLIATTSMPLQKGKWLIKVTSDDGVRVIVDGKTVIENWTHHGPTMDSFQFEVAEATSIPITVEYFQIAGFAVLEFQIEPMR